MEGAASPDLEMAELGADVPIVCAVDLGMYRLNSGERGGPPVWRVSAGLEMGLARVHFWVLLFLGAARFSHWFLG